MEQTWHAIPIKHPTCGTDASILEVDACREGLIVFVCVCVICGEQFLNETSMADILGFCIVHDLKDEKEAKTDLDHYVSTGKPN